ncbi:cell division protein FtsQ/DivIB [Flavobacteriaceae bacterium M23B6Z8]
MRRSWKIIRLVLAVMLAIGLFSFTNTRNDKRKLAKLEIRFTDGQPPFITYPTVNKLLIQNEAGITSIAKEKLVLNTLENVLNNNQMIQEAQVYMTVNGQLEARIHQRKPIARIESSDSYYLDSEGKKMPLSPVFSARVPLITGNIDENQLSTLYKLAAFIIKDDFLQKNITGIHVERKNMLLSVRAYDFKIALGKVEGLEGKFRNFKAFYQKALKDATLNNYKVVNLKFDNQVVCTKK